MLQRSAVALLCLLGTGNYCSAQSTDAATPAASKTPAEIFSLAAKQSDIRAAGSPPFRLKATFTAIDEHGKATTGEYSEVWITKDRWRRDLSNGNQTESTACVSGTYYASASDEALNGGIDEFIENMTPSMPEVKDADKVNRTWSVEPRTVVGVPLLRVAHVMTFGDAGKVLETSYLFMPQQGYVLGYASLSQSAVYSKLRAISGKIVPDDIKIRYPGTKRTLEINLTSFESRGNASDDSLILPRAAKGKCSSGKQELDSGVIVGHVLSRPAPVYPARAREVKATGTVKLHVTIGRHGEVRNIHIVSSPRADLAASAIAAVRSYKYKPFLQDNVPVEVEGTITVNYATRNLN